MKALRKLFCTVCSLGLLAGCGDTVTSSKIHDTGFVFCGHSAPTSFNPQLVDSGITSEVLSRQLFDSLMKLDPVSHEPIPGLAEKWSVNDEGTEYLFQLRQDVQFQTTAWFTPSRPLNADDVVFSFNRIIDPNHPFHAIGQTAYPWFNSIGFRDLVESVEAIDPLQVRIRLHRPDNTFLPNIATAFAVIHSAEYANTLMAKGKPEQIDAHPVGTGPFFLDDYLVGDLIRLKRHSKYWRGEPKMHQIVLDISARGTGPLAKLLRNECDVLSSPLSSQIPVIRNNKQLVLEAKDAMNVAFIAINTVHPALNDARVRRALSLSVNRQNILDSVYYGTGSQAYTLLPPSSWAYEKDAVRVRYDRNYALGLLRDAGYQSGLELTMWVPLEPQPYNPSPRKTAELLQASFADIGVKLDLLTSDRFTRSELSQIANIDLILTGWNASTGDPDNFLRPLLSCEAEQAGLNVSMWCNPDFDFLLDLAKETSQVRFRRNLYREAQNIIHEEVPVIPLAHGVQFQAHHQSLTGFDITPFSSQTFYNVERR